MLARRMRTMPLHVFDCKMIEETGTDRPDGFPDYQLFICVSGKGIIKDVSGAEQQMKAGDIMYIPSFAGHCYYPASAEPWMIKYISFNGLSIPDGFLDALGMPEHICIWSGMPHYAELHALFQRIAEAYAERSYIDDLSMYALLYRLLYTLFLDTHSTPPVAGGEGSVPAAVLRYIETHLDAELLVNSVAEATQTTVYFLYKSFKATFGTTPWEYILSRRLELARQLLVSDSSLTLRDIGLMTGMPSKNYLNRRFKSEYGMTPGEYRKMHLARSGVQNDFTKKLCRYTLQMHMRKRSQKIRALTSLTVRAATNCFFVQAAAA